MTETGIWDINEANYHVYSQDLTVKLVKVLNPDIYVIDMGCGMADYINELVEANYPLCRGIEGTSLPSHYGLDIHYLDLSKPLDLGIYGQVLSFEVGEHIPEQFEDVFIDNLTKHCVNKLIISWALPGQIGIGHVNCQTHEHIILQMARRDFMYNPEQTEFMRDAPYIDAPWFKDTLMVFDRW